ncbi:MAG: hypothetical protein MZV65_42920 [Chromatiales bacterium]|nr:hypothetical protein [Chromatiales bacterium]
MSRLDRHRTPTSSSCASSRPNSTAALSTPRPDNTDATRAQRQAWREEPQATEAAIAQTERALVEAELSRLEVRSARSVGGRSGAGSCSRGRGAGPPLGTAAGVP